MYNFQMTKYYKKDSIIHNMNPLIKLICILIFAITIVITNKIYILLIMLLFTIILMIFSKVPFRQYIYNIKFTIPFIIFIIIINLFTRTYNLIIPSILKTTTMILYSGILVYTTKPNDLTYGLEELLKPLKILKINSGEIALTISLAIRFIPTIFEQMQKVLKSQKSRGLNFTGNLKEKCDKIISVIIPVFSLSLKRSEEISNSLEMRLYRVNEKRTRYKEYKFNDIDESILLMHILILLFFILDEVIL